jgi:hypothetical protein
MDKITSSVNIFVALHTCLTEYWTRAERLRQQAWRLTSEGGEAGERLPRLDLRRARLRALQRAAEVPLACRLPKPRPPARLPPPPAAWLGAQAGLSSKRLARPSPASVRAASGTALVIFTALLVVSAPAPTRPAPACVNASSASSDTRVGGHHSGGRHAEAAHATDVPPFSTAACAIASAAAAAVPLLPLQPPTPTPAADGRPQTADVQGLGSTGLTALRSCHRTARIEYSYLLTSTTTTCALLQ